jgi:hypothetical protein
MPRRLARIASRPPSWLRGGGWDYEGLAGAIARTINDAGRANETDILYIQIVPTFSAYLSMLVATPRTRFG